VGEAAATSLAMVVHELATNSLKYGALSSDAGTLDVSTRSQGDDISLIWMERGGPLVEAPPEEEGFGSKLVRRSVSRQLGGTIEHDWSEGGLVVTVHLSRAKLNH
jgi:two-component sensor histidine kinase